MPYAYTRPPGWASIRRRILARDNHTCYRCGAPARDVDHLTPVARGGSHDDVNLAAICKPCHDIKSRAEKVDGTRRFNAKRRRPTERHPGDVG